MIGVEGNHGKTSGTRGGNLDNIVYTASGVKLYTPRPTVFLTHKVPIQVGTPARRAWVSSLAMHGYKLICGGHHHTFYAATVGDVWIVANAGLQPVTDYVLRKGFPPGRQGQVLLRLEKSNVKEIHFIEP